MVIMLLVLCFLDYMNIGLSSISMVGYWDIRHTHKWYIVIQGPFSLSLILLLQVYTTDGLHESKVTDQSTLKHSYSVHSMFEVWLGVHYNAMGSKWCELFLIWYYTVQFTLQRLNTYSGSIKSIWLIYIKALCSFYTIYT